MYKLMDIFSGSKGLHISFHDAYTDVIEESKLTAIIQECFFDTPVYNLKSKYQLLPNEYYHARHLADLDIIECFCSIFVRNHRNYKYCKGKTDTAYNVVHALEINGIHITTSTYNNWRRQKNYRLIDNESLEQLLELLKIAPNDFKQLIYAHAAANREINNNIKSYTSINLDAEYFNEKRINLGNPKLVRPPSLYVS